MWTSTDFVVWPNGTSEFLEVTHFSDQSVSEWRRFFSDESTGRVWLIVFDSPNLVIMRAIWHSADLGGVRFSVNIREEE